MVIASFSSVLNFFIQGGFFMFLLLICSVLSVTMILLRGLALRRETVMPKVIVNSVDQMQPQGDEERIARLARLVRGDPSSLGRLVQVGLQHLRWPKSENVEAVQTQARHEMVRLEKGLIVLEVIVGITPLLGLLGTVAGLVRVFATLGMGEGLADPRGIAAGIAEALNTTIAGLAIAVPSLIAFSYFSRKIEGMSVAMESILADLLSKCYYRQSTREETAE